MWANIGNGAVVNLSLFERVESREDQIVGTYPDGRQVVLAAFGDQPDHRGKMALFERRIRAVMNDGIGIADLAPEPPAPPQRAIEERTEKPFYLPDS